MTVGGSGIGGNVGGPQQFSTTELEMTAATNFAKWNLGILKDSSLTPFSDFSREATWKYQSGANNPTLSAPLLSVRMATPRKDDNIAWKEELLKLLKQLPDDVRERLLQQKKLPLEERSAALYVLDLILGFLAKATIWQQQAVQRMQADVVIETARYHADLAGRAIEEMVELGDESLELAEIALKKLGRNYRHFDLLKHNLQQTQELINDLRHIPMTVSPAREQREEQAYLAIKISNWNAQLHATEQAPQLQIIAAVARAINILSEVSWRDSTPFLASWQHAFIGMQTDQSKSGQIGTSLMLLIQNLTALLVKPESVPILRQQLEPLFLGLAALTMQYGAAQAEGKEELDVKQFLMEMFVHLALSSGILEGIVAQITRLCEVSDQEEEALNACILLATVLLIMEATVRERQAKSNFLEGLHPYLERWIGLILKQGFKSNPQLLLLEQMRIALKKNDYETLIEGLARLQKSLQFPSEELQKNLKEIGHYAHFVHFSLNEISLENKLSPATHIQQVA